MDAGGGRGGAGAQEWEGGGLDALRGAGGWGRGLAGEAPRGNERVRQQQTKHCRRGQSARRSDLHTPCQQILKFNRTAVMFLFRFKFDNL